MTAPRRVLLSTAEESFGFAVRELRGVYGNDLKVKRVGPDLGAIATEVPDVADVAAACRSRHLAFIRHLTVQVARLDLDEARDVRAVATAAHKIVSEAGVPGGLAVQAWVSGTSRVGYGSREVFTAISDELAAHGVSVSRGGGEQTLSCCVTIDGVLLGLNPADLSLSDWPGGRVRLARPPQQISRSEFKLEELLATFPLPLSTGRRAVDFGASPGGWTRILRTHGLDVTAVDPGDLSPALASDRRVHHFRTTVGQFLESNRTRFHVVVNDMRMDARMACRVMLDTAPHLTSGAYAVITLKTGSRHPVEQIRDCLELLRDAYDIAYVRQLYHNRSEVTVVATKRG